MDLASVAPIPPPKLYTDHVLPLNPASLSSGAMSSVPRGHASSGHVSLPGTGHTSGAGHGASSLYAVTNNTNNSVESKTFNSSEISV